MEIVAYWVALGTIVTVPPFLSLWFIVHPFTRKWRRLGPTKTYLILISVLIPIMTVIFLFREVLLRIHFGVSRFLVILAVFFLLAMIYVGIRRARYLTPDIMFGLPQLSEHKYPGKLINEGIYAHIRNPRYLEVGLGLTSIALFCNYLATYVLLIAYIPIIYWVVILEERELKERFEREYEQYCRDVPRFIPRFIHLRRNRV
jgi:protein-S-isoprenylcysteine O-methyltransferase Ste14